MTRKITRLVKQSKGERKVREHMGVFFGNMSIESLGLSVRSLNCLKNASINVVRDLIAYSEDDLMKLKNFGQKSLDEIKEKLGKYHLSLMPSSREDYNDALYLLIAGIENGQIDSL